MLEEAGGGVAMGGEDCECGAGDDVACDVALDGDGEESSSIAMSGDSSLTRTDADPDAPVLLVFSTILRPDLGLPRRAPAGITLCASRCCCCLCCIRRTTRQRREDEDVNGNVGEERVGDKHAEGERERTRRQRRICAEEVGGCVSCTGSKPATQ